MSERLSQTSCLDQVLLKNWGRGRFYYFFKNGSNRSLFRLFFVLLKRQILNKFDCKWQKHRWWAWDSNPGSRMVGADESTELLWQPPPPHHLIAANLCWKAPPVWEASFPILLLFNFGISTTMLRRSINLSLIEDNSYWLRSAPMIFLIKKYLLSLSHTQSLFTSFS